MFCVNCGAAMDGTVTACAACGRGLPPPSASAEQAGRVIKAASMDALGALRQIAVDPVGGLSSSFGKLGEERARAAGMVFGAAFALMTTVAAVIAAVKFHTDVDSKVLVGGLISGLVPFASITAVSAAARKLLGGAGTLGADLFTAGVALQPLAIWFVISAFLGIGNFGTISLLGLFACTYVLCILFVGCTRLALVPERFAPPAVAVMVLLSLWLWKVMVSSFFGTSQFGSIFS
jgi:hypothetical protein